ncbi:MAG: M20 family metallopeptidase [Anaerotruncus sp.]|nr:M20 family metallopeptidase [Anaerotruncus sp.]
MKQYPFAEEQFLQDLRGLLQIRSVNGDNGPVTPEAPLGEGVYKALDYMLTLGKKFGFRTKMLDGYCGWIEMGEGEHMVGVLAHVDTVTVNPEGWLAEPFDGTIIDGKLYGRGTSDDKGPAMLALYAMKEIADSGIKPDKRIRLILGGDEEAGDWQCMRRYKQTEESPSCAFSPDGEYPVTFAEKGILHIDLERTLDPEIHPITFESGKMYNVVPALASAQVKGVSYEATGRAAHAMEPEKGDNAMLKLCAELRGKGIAHPFLELAKIASREGFGVCFSDEPSGELTVNPSIGRVDAKKAYMGCDLRIPVTIPLEQVTTAIEKSIAPFGFTLTVNYFKPPLYVEQDSPLVQTLQRIYAEASGDTCPPVSSGGGTYARAFPNAVAFGALFPDDPVTYHQTNECWSLDSIRRTFQIIVNAIASL